MQATKTPFRVAVVGGGLAGLCAALDLAKAGAKVTVFEKYPQMGGLASAFPIHGTHLERFYHHVFATDLDFLALVDELGLQSKLVWHPEDNGSWYQGKYYPFTPNWKLLFFSPLSLWDRFRLGFWSKLLSLKKDWRPFDKVSAKAWILKHMGLRVWQVMWEPLFRAKFGQYADQVSMTWFYGRLSARFGPAKKGAPSASLGYLEGSTQVLVDALEAKLRAAGVELLTSHPIKRLLGDLTKVTGIESKAGVQEFDAVLVTCATPLYLQIEGGLLSETQRKPLQEFKYLGSVIAILELTQPLAPAYWTNILDVESPFLAVIEHTRMVSADHYEGTPLMYLARYLDTTDAFFRAPDAQVLADYYAYLVKVLPAFEPSMIKKAHVMRADYTQPIVLPGHGDRIPGHRQGPRGLYLANMTQIFPEDRGMSYSIGMGRKVATMILQDQGA